MLYVLALLGLVMPLLSRSVAGMSTMGWGVDLATHWQWLCVPVALSGALGGWRGRARRFALTLFAFGLAGLLWVMPPFAPGAPAGTEARLRLITANVHLDNTDPAGLLAWGRSLQVEVILLQEVSPAYAAALEQQASDFPHRKLVPRDDPFGIGLISRFPLEEVSVLPGPDGIPSLQASLQTPAGAIPIVVAHPFPPLSESAHRNRAALIAALDARASRQPALVVAGDFNASPWSSAFAGVRHLALASHALPTWQHVLPIDHVLVGRDWVRLQTERGPADGSDHRPLFVALGRKP